MVNSRSAIVGWLVGAAFFFGSFADTASAFPWLNAYSTDQTHESASICAGPPIWRSGEASIGGKAISIADSGDRYSSGWIDRIISAISIFREEEEEGSSRVEALSRDSSSKSLAIPLLAAPVRQSIVAGTRPFHIAWVGGKAPFAVQLIGPAGATVARWPQTAEHSVVATVSLAQGFYELRITDATGQPVLGGFEATSQAPTVDRRGVDELPPDLGASLIAARLTDIDDGAWQLEAYERLTAEPNGDASRIIANRLAHGLSVSELCQQGAQPH